MSGTNLVVMLANACTQPGAMVVVLGDADVAGAAVSRAERSDDVTRVTPLHSECVAAAADVLIKC